MFRCFDVSTFRRFDVSTFRRFDVLAFWRFDVLTFMQRFLGIDYGTKRIGLAVGDDLIRIASPIETIEACGEVAEHVRAVMSAAEAYGVDAFLVGLPLNMDGTEGEQAKITRRFGDELGRVTGKPVHYFDERLSSSAAQELLRPADLTRRKRKSIQDAVAAQVILQGFLGTSDP
jgi:putative Holliday junction resolvase